MLPVVLGVKFFWGGVGVFFSLKGVGVFAGETFFGSKKALFVFCSGFCGICAAYVRHMLVFDTTPPALAERREKGGRGASSL